MKTQKLGKLILNMIINEDYYDLNIHPPSNDQQKFKYDFYDNISFEITIDLSLKKVIYIDVFFEEDHISLIDILYKKCLEKIYSELNFVVIHKETKKVLEKIYKRLEM